MPQSFACLNYHLIFSTKNRESMLDDDFRSRLFEYIGGIVREERGALLSAGGMPDHVHLLVSFHQQTSVADALRLIKANSSKWIHEKIPGSAAFAWQARYGAFSVSYSRIPHIKKYLGSQAEHHRTTTFQEEFLAFLRRHDMQFAERYLWD